MKTNGLSEHQLNEKEKRDKKKKERLEAAREEARKEKDLYSISPSDFYDYSFIKTKKESISSDDINQENEIEKQNNTSPEKSSNDSINKASEEENKSKNQDEIIPLTTSMQLPQKEEYCLKKIDIIKNASNEINSIVDGNDVKEYDNGKAPQLEIYYRNKKKKQSDEYELKTSQIKQEASKCEGYIMEQRSHDSEECSNAMEKKSSKSSTPTMKWSKEMDKQLSNYVQECMYDFAIISEKMNIFFNNDYNVNYTALLCRLRWCKLDETVTQNENEQKQNEGKEDEVSKDNNTEVVKVAEYISNNAVVQESKKQLYTFEELEEIALSKPSAYVHPPKIFPTCHLTEEDDDNEFVFYHCKYNENANLTSSDSCSSESNCSATSEENEIKVIEDYYKKRILLSDPLEGTLPSSSSEDWQYLLNRIRQVKSKI